MIARANANQDSNEDVDQLRDGAGFVHLHVHSSYSLREGALSVAKLAKLAVAESMPALAITDTNNLFGALEFSEKLAKEGVQPIVGMQITLDFGMRRRWPRAARRTRDVRPSCCWLRTPPAI